MVRPWRGPAPAGRAGTGSEWSAQPRRRRQGSRPAAPGCRFGWRAISFLDPRHDAGPHHLREPGRVPIGQADAAMALGPADGLRLGRAVNAVMLLRQVDPD